MLRTLYSKLLAVLLCLFLLLGVVFVLLTAYSTEMYQMEVSQKLNRELAAHIVSEQHLLEGARIDRRGLSKLFNMMMVINPAIEIYLLDPQGQVLADAAPDKQRRRTRVNLDPVRAFVDGSDAFPILGDDPRMVSGRKAFSAAPILANGKLQGYLYVILGGQDFDTIAQRLQGSFIGRLSAWAVVASLLFALIAAAVIFWLMMRRLKQLACAMEDFRAGDFRVSPAMLTDTRRARDEVDRLSATFAQMAQRIDRQMRRLEHNDELRRELVANVSHDLRTPLASLQGYLETLLIKNAQLTPAERLHYVEIAARHCRRLAQRIGELFELAKLEAQDNLPHCEPIHLAELAQDVVIKFKLEAEQKGIAITTTMAAGLPFVHADIALIERVLDNLIDNALRHTPARGEVRVGLATQGTQMCLSVSDTGPGIAAQDLPHIFERFYRGRDEANARCDGAGLGLAITQRIVALHGGSIDVTSDANTGTCFNILLPLAPTFAATA